MKPRPMVNEPLAYVMQIIRSRLQEANFRGRANVSGLWTDRTRQAKLGSLSSGFNTRFVPQGERNYIVAGCNMEGSDLLVSCDANLFVPEVVVLQQRGGTFIMVSRPCIWSSDSFEYSDLAIAALGPGVSANPEAVHRQSLDSQYKGVDGHARGCERWEHKDKVGPFCFRSQMKKATQPHDLIGGRQATWSGTEIRTAGETLPFVPIPKALETLLSSLNGLRSHSMNCLKSGSKRELPAWLCVLSLALDWCKRVELINGPEYKPAQSFPEKSSTDL
ncbi:hypothetical protein OE88DRAFT_1747107 [Heliocybe sulcata]|uniref:Uncharacterized protein n=1 Tax=Heliocybe sulcata TaxID=5364 RepID=A0A5C3N2W0_9AGAM|nr:hypothetical protein OE88DRAFT_1747107 [Heliocybe sulcata]